MSSLEARIFTRERLGTYGLALLLAYIVAFALRCAAGTWVIEPGGHPTFIDFNWLWVGGQFGWARDAAGAYDYPSFAAAQAQLGSVTRGSDPYYPWSYPPTLLLLVAPLALFPYLVAFFVWTSATLCLYLAAIYTILPRRLTLLLAVLPFAVEKNLQLGHTGFVVAGLVGLSLALMERRPYLAGICLGLLTYKPQIGLLFPIVLLAGGEWRVIAGAVASALLFAFAACLAFGFQVWGLFLHAFEASDPHKFLTIDNGVGGGDATMQTVFGLAHWAGFGLGTAWAIHLVVAIPVAVLVVVMWRRPVPHGLKAAALAIGALVVTPYILAYDLTTISVPAAFLVREGMSTGFIAGERLALLACLVAMFLALGVPIGPVILAVLLALVVRRVVRVA